MVTIAELAILLEAGKYEVCLDMIFRSCLSESEIEDPVTLNIAGICFAQLGELSAAEDMFKKALAVDERYEKARLNLVNVLFDRVKVEEAIEQSYLLADTTTNSIDIIITGLRRNAREISSEELVQYLLGCIPRHAERRELGLIYEESGAVWLSIGRTELALEMLEKAYGYDPDSKTIKEVYGCALAQTRKYHQCLDVLLVSPNDFQYLSKPAQAAVLKCLREIGKTHEAVRLVDSLSIQRLVAMPLCIEVCSVLIKDMQECRALELLKQASSNTEREKYLVVYTTARALRGLNRYREAQIAVNHALEFKEDSVDALNLLGILSQDSGEFEKARSSFTKALGKNGSILKRAILFRQLTELASSNDVNNLMEIGLQLMEDLDLSSYTKSVCLYGMAKLWHIEGNFERAYNCYTIGGSERQRADLYSVDQDKQMFCDIQEHTSRILSVKIQPNEIGFVPIFVVGMPRSGTSLVTQILASHSQFDTVGETNAVAKFGHDLCFGFKQPSEALIKQFRERVAESMLQRSPMKTKFIVEKMPKNFLYIHLLRSAFPDALILHVKRNPQATIWSNFIQYFPAKGLNYSFSLSDTVSFFSLYRNLMKNWDALEIEFVNLDYGKLIERPREQILDIFDAIGVPVEENCFKPENHRSIIKTASNTQVRFGITSGYDGKWKEYQDFLSDDFRAAVY